MAKSINQLLKKGLEGKSYQKCTINIEKKDVAKLKLLGIHFSELFDTLLQDFLQKKEVRERISQLTEDMNNNKVQKEQDELE